MKATRSERRVLGRESAAAIKVSRSDDSFVFDVRGRKYVDFTSGWCVGNLGWSPTEATRALRRFRGPTYVYPGFGYRPWIELAQLLTSIAPPGLTTCFRATGGTEAVDLAIQAAQVHTGRPGLLSLEGSYHGNSIATLSIGASENREDNAHLLPQCHKIAPPLDQRALERIERRLQRRNVAAFIMEPISINLGVLIPESGFMEQLQRLCRRYGTVLVMDEVATGFGRTGTLFASEQFDLRPDILCLAKAITGGLAPLGAMIASEAIAKSMEKKGTFYSTYGWHPRSVAVAIATVRYLVRHQTRLLSRVATTSRYFTQRLKDLSFRRPVIIRTRGLAIGVDVGDGDYAETIEDRCQRNGLLITTVDSTLLLLPPLSIARAVAARGLDVLAACV